MFTHNIVKGNIMECTKIFERGVLSYTKSSKGDPIPQEFDGTSYYDAKILKKDVYFVNLKYIPEIYIPEEKFSFIVKLRLWFIIKYNKTIPLDQKHFFPWSPNHVGDKFVEIPD